MFYLSASSGPEYLPDDFDIPDNYNILQISEIHAFEEFNEAESENYSQEVARQVNSYTEKYDVDEIHVMGDTGTFDDVYNFLDTLNPGPEVVIVAGDEDKKDANPGPGEKSDEFTGFYTQINSLQPFDVDVDYQIFDEGFEKEVAGNKVQAAHHPRKSKRENSLNRPDPRPDSFLDDLFSVEKHTNEKTAECMIYEAENNKKHFPKSGPDEGNPELRENDMVKSPPSLKGLDVVVYDHLHMPYARTAGNTVVMGLGGRKNNHDPGTEALPSESMHLASFGDERIHSMHFDAGKDRIFEHQVFEQSETDVQMYDVEIPEELNSEGGYRPVQKRFRREKIPEEAWEFEEDLPEKWTEEVRPAA
ncbi:hypothetical protein GKQ38_04125 [Candidatus Nanohaloarchaea archaeon]|nr:hypothetical protein GKQ38_04125 [Candidatus Nanohaloarchaea archaeon]